jgi:hypothetical protein
MERRFAPEASITTTRLGHAVGAAVWRGSASRVHCGAGCLPATRAARRASSSHLITDVQTTPAKTADGDLTPAVHAALHGKNLLPKQHRVDTGYLDTELLVSNRETYGMDW